MGFGTGHHATTRLCLAALQNENLSGAFVLDVGTGSGILAIAATRLGAAQAYGIDFDPDAIQSASENLALNPEAHNVTFVVGDLLSVSLSRADIVVANLTGAVLIRSADSLIEAVRTGGTVIASGILVTEADEVRRAFGVAILLRREQEDEWVCLVMKKV
jgi:ribosomal protein L11 methyltransferase